MVADYIWLRNSSTGQTNCNCIYNYICIDYNVTFILQVNLCLAICIYFYELYYFSLLIFPSCSVTTYPVYTATDYEIY